MSKNGDFSFKWARSYNSPYINGMDHHKHPTLAEIDKSGVSNPFSP